MAKLISDHKIVVRHQKNRSGLSYIFCKMTNKYIDRPAANNSTKAYATNIKAELAE